MATLEVLKSEGRIKVIEEDQSYVTFHPICPDCKEEVRSPIKMLKEYNGLEYMTCERCSNYYRENYPKRFNKTNKNIVS
ncbi:hypothetical protein [Bacillus cereus]|uniref:hypothetical protein n=1 Tax=Bacillus cereus TaxID=1396 RepID=UPI000BEDFCC1|nr:hypothetical protein [Bacillus cereus]PDY76941.1 hypothetical protein CON06_27635 [Bacillus cereus]